jgi:hypothetical protein
MIMAKAAVAISNNPPADSLDKNARKAENLADRFNIMDMSKLYGDQAATWQVKVKN